MNTTLFRKVPFSFGLIQGTGLYKTLPSVTDEAVRNAFDEGFEDQNEEKYSDSIIVKSNETGVLYTLYKSYGNWRIGAKNDACESDFELFIEALGFPTFAWSERVDLISGLQYNVFNDDEKGTKNEKMLYSNTR